MVVTDQPQLSAADVKVPRCRNAVQRGKSVSSRVPVGLWGEVGRNPVGRVSRCTFIMN